MELPAEEELWKITEAILFLARPDLRPVFRKALKELGISAVVTPDSVEDCIIELLKSDHGLLVLDWNENTEDVVKILGAAQGNFSADTRAIFLMAAEISSDLLAITAEYNVSRVHSGQVSIQTISGHLEAIILGEGNVSTLRSQLIRVAADQAADAWDAAEDQLNDLRDNFGDDPRLLGELINNLINQGKWKLALEVATELREAHPRDIRGMHLYGRCLLKFSRFEDACGVLKVANFLNPYNVDRLVDFGNALMNCNKVTEAEESFSAALAIDLGSSEAIKGKSKCRLMEGDVNEALKLLRQLSSARELASVFNDAAIISIRRGRFQAGLKLYAAAIKAVGAKPVIVSKLYFNFGIACHKAGDIKSAYAAFKAAVQSDLSFDAAVFNLRICATRLGKLEEFQQLLGPRKESSKSEMGSRAETDLIDDFEDSFEDEKNFS